MEYLNMYQATFLQRLNRFEADILLNGVSTRCHVKNTGRCKELLLPGADIMVQRADNPMRKTQYDLISVYKGTRLINIDSAAPNQVAREWFPLHIPDLQLLRPEMTYGNSRFDFYFEAGGKPGFLEVKGVTLEADGIVSFPDAPTQRGVKHVKELIQAVQDGYEAYLLFLIQMEHVVSFTPNRNTHPAFGEVLCMAQDMGVHLLAYDAVVTRSSITANQQVPIILTPTAPFDGA